MAYILKGGVSSLRDLRDGGALFNIFGKHRAFRANSNGDGDYTGIQSCVNAASRGDSILIDATAEYDANITITTSGLSFFGVGAPRAVRVTSVGTNSTAFTINGAYDTYFHNLNLSGRGSGDAVKLTGQIRRATFENCRLAGASTGNGVQIAASSGGQVVDVVFQDCRIEGQDGVEFSTGEGGDPASQIYFKNCDFQYCGVLAINHPTNSYSTGFFVQGCKFLPEEDGTVPSTGWIKADNAAQTGMISGCYFADTVFASARIAIGAGVLFVGNFTETESVNGGTSGRPD